MKTFLLYSTLLVTAPAIQEAGFHFGAEGATFDRFMIWFYIPSVSRAETGATYEENKLYFSIYSQVYPKISDNQQRIDTVHVNDIELHRENTSETTSFRQFVTEGKVAHEILELFESKNAATLVLGLSGGEVATLNVPTRSTERFNLWSKLLFTCASEIGTQQEQTN